MGLEKYSKSGFVQMSSMRDVAHLNGRSGSIRPAGGREAPVGSCQRRSDRQGVPGVRSVARSVARSPSLPAGRPLLESGRRARSLASDFFSDLVLQK